LHAKLEKRSYVQKKILAVLRDEGSNTFSCSKTPNSKICPIGLLGLGDCILIVKGDECNFL